MEIHRATKVGIKPENLKDIEVMSATRIETSSQKIQATTHGE
jgi:hypothetical protein